MEQFRLGTDKAIQDFGNSAYINLSCFFFQLTLAYGGALLTSDNAMTSDFESMIENDRMSTGGEECESPYWASAGNFTAGNKKSKFKKRGKFQSKKKKSNYQAASK